MTDTGQPNDPGKTRGESSTNSAFDMVVPYLHPGRENVVLIYVLYLAGLIPAFGVVPIIIGFVMALLNRGTASGVWASHYEYQFRQAAVGLAFAVVSFILMFVLIGFLGFLLLAIWWIVRSVKGLQAASHDQAIIDPKSLSW
jgi:uncharacterized membrane protein